MLTFWVLDLIVLAFEVAREYRFVRGKNKYSAKGGGGANCFQGGRRCRRCAQATPHSGVSSYAPQKHGVSNSGANVAEPSAFKLPQLDQLG